MQTENRRIKIAYFVTSLEVGGTEQSLVRLMEDLDQEQFEIHLICLAGFGPLELQARATGATLIDLRYPRIRKNGRIHLRALPEAAATIMRLLKVLRKLKPDILHCMIPVCSILGALCGKLAGVPCGVTTKLAMGIYRDKNPLLARMENIADRWYDCVHCKSEQIARDVAMREPWLVGKLKVIYNGVDTETYRPAVTKQSPRLVIGSVANLIPYKGHKDLITAFSLALTTLPGLQLRLIGRDVNCEQAKLECIAQDLGVSDRVVFLGERKDIAEQMVELDAYVCSSHEEGFSNVILEAMACGLPVIATRVGGNPESVDNEITGLLVPPHNPQALSEAIVYLFDNSERLNQMGDAGRQRVTQYFAKESITQKITTLYQHLFNNIRHNEP